MIIAKVTSNPDEYSRTITRADGNRLDVCAMRSSRELVVAVVNDDAIPVEEVAFSPDEVEVLKEHLADPETQAILAN